MSAQSAQDAATAAIEAALRGRIAGDLLTDRFSLTAYATAACIYKIMPLAVVVPKDAGDVEAAVRAAGELDVPVIPRGAGSGLCGQALGRGVVLDFTKYMTEVMEIDASGGLVRVQPGAVTGRVNEALAPHGLMLGPDPSSEAFSTIGGNLGNNASGSRGIRYGSMKDYVAWLDVVLADGSGVRLEPMAAGDARLAALEARGDLAGRIAAGTRRLAAENAELISRYEPHTSKNSAGYNLFEVLRGGTYDPTRLVVGSEGTLAVIVEAGLRAVPRPRERASVLLWFSSLESAGAAIEPVLALAPSACEIMERHFLDIVRGDGSVPKEYLPKEADTVLLVEFLSDSRRENDE
ncbi:MAG: FAD-binding oxidoreductase, partial [Planctomycetes bacterium]|nr:FAD-binding oxidoreductase [Planctomycetota bacterium]